MDDEENKATIKILVLGPQKAGKTTLTKFLSEYIEEPQTTIGKGNDSKKLEFDLGGEYRPTKGVRIEELESYEFFSVEDRETFQKMDRKLNFDIQIWDVSGDSKFEECWPAIKDGSHGVILVANPEVHQGKDLLPWYREFVERENIDLRCVMVLLNEQGPKNTNHEMVSAFEIIPQLRDANHASLHFGTEAAQVKLEISQYFTQVVRMIHQRRGSSHPDVLVSSTTMVADAPDENVEDDGDSFGDSDDF